MSQKYLIACTIASILTIIIGIILIIIASIFVADIGYLHNPWTRTFILLIYSIVNGILASLFATGLLYIITRQFPTLATCFAYFLTIIIFLTTICSIVLLSDRLDLQTTSINKLQTLFNNYSDSDNITSSKFLFQRIQQSFQCCGVKAYDDWQSKISDGNSTVDSCCRNVTIGCGKNAIETKINIYLRGCAIPIYDHLKNIYTILIGINITIAILALASCVTGLIFEKSTRERYEQM